MRSGAKTLAVSVGMDPDQFGAHSFRIGGATALFATGADPTVIGFTLYDLSRSQEGEYGIKTITREVAKTKMKPPACEAVWELKLAQRIQFDKVWKIKADYVSPRDQIAWLKIQHRNPWWHREDCTALPSAARRGATGKKHRSIWSDARPYEVSSGIE